MATGRGGAEDCFTIPAKIEAGSEMRIPRRRGFPMKAQDRLPNRGVNWVLKIFLSEMPNLKLYAQFCK